jgi:hypothetical protein
MIARQASAFDLGCVETLLDLALFTGLVAVSGFPLICQFCIASADLCPSG